MARLLQCPFCTNLLARPVDLRFKSMELTGGICRCGAVYVFDRTGHNLGEIYLEALTFACRGDAERALSLDPEEYETIDFDYDISTNTVGRRKKEGLSGRLLFVKLKEIG